MADGGVSWLPGLLVLAAGLVVGFVLMRRLRGRSDRAPAAAEAIEERDLLARHDALIAQLRELDDLAPKREPSQLAAERRALEHDAARVLRELDRFVAAAAAGAQGRPPSPPAPSDRAARRGFLWGMGTAAAVGLLFFLVSRSITERETGGSPTGETPGASAPADATLSALREAVRRKPDDIDARLDLARAALEREDLEEAYDQTRHVLARAPGHPRALTYEAFVRLQTGQAETAERMLAQALAADPDLLEAYVNLSLVHLRMGRTEAAGADLEEAARRHPSRAAGLRALWSRMRVAAEEAPQAAPAGGPGVSGSLALSPGLEQRVSSGAVVFIIVRPEGVTSGPPVAARRLRASSFPLAFTVGAADSMMGAVLPDRVRVEARVDFDGDAATRDVGAPSASVDGVRLGTTDLRLVLRE